jgi:hypothetical protein
MYIQQAAVYNKAGILCGHNRVSLAELVQYIKVDNFLNGTSALKLSSLLIVGTYHTNEYPQIRDQRLENGRASNPPDTAATSFIGRFSCSDIYECKWSEDLFDSN